MHDGEQLGQVANTGLSSSIIPSTRLLAQPSKDMWQRSAVGFGECNSFCCSTAVAEGTAAQNQVGPETLSQSRLRSTKVPAARTNLATASECWPQKLCHR